MSDEAKEKQALLDLISIIASLAGPIAGSIVRILALAGDLSEQTKEELAKRIEKAQASVPEWR